MFNFSINTTTTTTNREFQSLLHFFGEIRQYFSECSYKLYYGLFIFVLVGLVYIIITALFNQNDSSAGGNSSVDSSAGGNSSDSPLGGGPEDDERRRERIKRIWISLGVVTAIVIGCCGASYILCEGDWFAFITSPKFFWTSVGASLGFVRKLTTRPDMAIFLNEIWGDVFVRIISKDSMIELLGDLEFENSAIFRKMQAEVFHIPKREIIRAVVQAYPDGATEHLLTKSLEKALACEIQTIGLKYANLPK